MGRCINRAGQGPSCTVGKAIRMQERTPRTRTVSSCKRLFWCVWRFRSLRPTSYFHLGFAYGLIGLHLELFCIRFCFADRLFERGWLLSIPLFSPRTLFLCLELGILFIIVSLPICMFISPPLADYRLLLSAYTNTSIIFPSIFTYVVDRHPLNRSTFFPFHSVVIAYVLGYKKVYVHFHHTIFTKEIVTGCDNLKMCM